MPAASHVALAGGDMRNAALMVEPSRLSNNPIANICTGLRIGGCGNRTWQQTLNREAGGDRQHIETAFFLRLFCAGLGGDCPSTHEIWLVKSVEFRMGPLSACTCFTRPSNTVLCSRDLGSRRITQHGPASPNPLSTVATPSPESRSPSTKCLESPLLCDGPCWLQWVLAFSTKPNIVPVKCGKESRGSGKESPAPALALTPFRHPELSMRDLHNLLVYPCTPKGSKVNLFITAKQVIWSFLKKMRATVTTQQYLEPQASYVLQDTTRGIESVREAESTSCAPLGITEILLSAVCPCVSLAKVASSIGSSYATTLLGFAALYLVDLLVCVVVGVASGDGFNLGSFFLLVGLELAMFIFGPAMSLLVLIAFHLGLMEGEKTLLNLFGPAIAWDIIFALVAQVLVRNRFRRHIGLPRDSILRILFSSVCCVWFNTASSASSLSKYERATSLHVIPAYESGECLVA